MTEGVSSVPTGYPTLFDPACSPFWNQVQLPVIHKIARTLRLAHPARGSGDCMCVFSDLSAVLRLIVFRHQPRVLEPNKCSTGPGLNATRIRTRSETYLLLK